MKKKTPVPSQPTPRELLLGAGPVKKRLNQWLATGICGNDITSSCLYVAAIAAVKALGAGGANLLCYKTSGDVTGDYSSVVGYAAIAFTKR